MALERFIPKSPDIFIRNSQDFEVAKFGHLNTIVEYINNNSAKPAGLNGYVQFNDNSALGGDAGLFWDNVNKSLGLGSSTPSYLSFKYNPSSGSTYVGGINIYQDGVNLFPIMDFTRFGDTVFRRQQRAIFIYYTNENNGINYTNGQLVSQIETTGVRNGIVGSTLFREGVVYNGDGITRRGRYSHGVAQQSGFGGFQYVATQYGNLKINIIGDNASAYIDDVISPTTAYNMHASNIINTTNNGSLPILSLDYNGLTKHVFQINGNVSFNNTADMAAILGIKGSGSTSATTSLLVQNSAGTAALTILDDRTSTFGNNVTVNTASGGVVQLGNSTTSIFRIVNTYERINIQPISTGGTLSLNAGTEAGVSYSANDSGHVFAYPFNRTAQNTFSIDRPFFGNVGATTKTMLSITTTNITALSNATLLRGLYINPTVTDWVSVRAIETTAGNVIINGGNVGIGTSSPTKKLDVVGTAADGIIRVAGPYSDIQLINKNSAYNVGDWKPAIRFLENGVFTADIAYSGSYFEFGAGLKSSTIYTTGGSNSIGITNADNTVDIGGRSQLITFTDYNYGVTRGGINLPYVASPSGYGMNIYVNSGDMTFGTGGSTRLTITQAGNIGVGATGPTAQLQVKGSGATSGTTAFLITNGAATPANLFSVTDDGKVTVKGNIDSIDSTITVRATTSLALTLTASQTTIGNHTAFTNGALDDLVNGNYFFRHSTSGNTFDFRDPTRVFLTTSNSGTIIQNTSFGGTAIAASALLEVQSTTKGFLPPRMTTAQRVAIASPTNGLIVFDTDVQNLCYRRDGVWVQATFAAV
jgi:hypothetical protein